MTDAAAVPKGNPESLRSDAPAGPPDFSGSSPLGSLAQYSRAKPLASLHNSVSVTGATKNDPAGALSRQPVLYDPDWASPMRTVWVVMREYSFSFLTYWMGYGFLLMLSLGIAQLLLGRANLFSSAGLGAALFVGPLFGFVLDFSIIVSHSAAAVVGVILLVAEPFLALLILVTHEWGARLKYCGLMFGLALVKAALYVLVNSAS